MGNGMIRMNKTLLILGLVVIVAVASVGIYYYNLSSLGPHEEKPLIIGSLRPVTLNLDPAQDFAQPTISFNKNVFDTLYELKVGVYPEAEYIPNLAAGEPTISSDGLEWTIPLRQGVKFHDGTPFNASAMKFSLDRVKELNSYPAWILDPVSEVEIVDDHTIKLILKYPYSPLKGVLSMAATAPVSPTAVQKMTLVEWQEKPVGTGPFKYVEWVGIDHITLERFEDYWNKDKIAKSKTIIYRIYSDASTLSLDLKKGAIDLAWIGVAMSDVPSLMENPDIEYKIFDQCFLRWITLNTGLPGSALQDVRVRRAIAYCIDQDEISEKIYDGLWPAKKDTVFGEGFFPKPSWEPYTDKVDVDKAKQLLEEAGYSDGIDVTLTYTDRYGKEQVDVAVTLQEQLAKAGIRVHLESLESAAFMAHFRAGGLEMALAMVGPDWMDADSSASYIAYSKASYPPRVHLNDTSIDQLVEIGRLIVDPVERAKIYGQIQDKLAEIMCYIPLVTEKNWWFYRSDVTGVESYYMNELPLWPIARK